METHELIWWGLLFKLIGVILTIAHLAVRRWEKPPLVAQEFGSNLAVCTRFARDEAKRSNQIFKPSKDREMAVVKDCVWINNRDLRRPSTIVRKFFGFRRIPHVHLYSQTDSSDEATLVFPVEIAPDLFVPDNPITNRFVNEFGFNSPTEYPLTIMRAMWKQLWETHWKFMLAQTAIHGLAQLAMVAFVIGLILLLGTGMTTLSNRSMDVTLTQPGLDQAIEVPGITWENHQSLLMYDSVQHVYSGKVDKAAPRGGGIYDVCIGKPPASICGDSRNWYGKGTTVYMRGGAVATKSMDDNNYTHDSNRRWVISKKEFDALLKTGKFTHIQR